MEPSTHAAVPVAIPLDQWVQVGTGGEEAKFGVASTDALEAWTTGVVNDPIQDLAAELAAMIEFAPHPNERRHGERRQIDRRRAVTEVRVEAEP